MDLSMLQTLNIQVAPRGTVCLACNANENNEVADKSDLSDTHAFQFQSLVRCGLTLITFPTKPFPELCKCHTGVTNNNRRTTWPGHRFALMRGTFCADQPSSARHEKKIHAVSQRKLPNFVQSYQATPRINLRFLSDAFFTAFKTPVDVIRLDSYRPAVLVKIIPRLVGFLTSLPLLNSKLAPVPPASLKLFQLELHDAASTQLYVTLIFCR